MKTISKLVLDTHVWIWFITGSSALNSSLLAIIEKAAATQNILLPSICVWEAAMLIRAGRITISMPVKDWLVTAASLPGITLVPLTAEIAIESCYLPGQFHKDPADRMIVATARIETASIVTKDKRIIDYASNGYVSVTAV